jgi:hypothetical protein
LGDYVRSRYRIADAFARIQDTRSCSAQQNLRTAVDSASALERESLEQRLRAKIRGADTSRNREHARNEIPSLVGAAPIGCAVLPEPRRAAVLAASAIISIHALTSHARVVRAGILIVANDSSVNANTFHAGVRRAGILVVANDPSVFANTFHALVGGAGILVVANDRRIHALTFHALIFGASILVVAVDGCMYATFNHVASICGTSIAVIATNDVDRDFR